MVWNKHFLKPQTTHLKQPIVGWIPLRTCPTSACKSIPCWKASKTTWWPQQSEKETPWEFRQGGRSGNKTVETRFVCDMCQIREGTESFTQKMCSDAYCLKKNCITICNYAVCLEVFLAQMFRVLFFATTHSFNQPLVGVDELWRMSFPWLPFGYHCPRTSFDPNGCRMKRWHPFNAMISHRTIWELKW